MKFIKFYFPIFVFAVLISIPLLVPYLHPGYFPTHDGEWAVVRLSDMFRLLRDLQIPARYSGNLNFGYGYPLFNFTYPFPYYLGTFIHLLGFGFVDSIKIMFALTIPFSAFFMFLASRKIWGNNWSGIVSSVLYLYFPYRLVDLFVRGSIGESFAFMLFPIILYSLASLLKKPNSIFLKILGAVSYAMLIASHNILAILFTLTLGLFFLGYVRKINLTLFLNYLFVSIFGLVLSAFFWIPALFEKSNILLSVVPIADRSLYFVNIAQLLNSPWGYGIPTDRINPFTYQLGWPFILVLTLALIVFILKKIKKLDKVQNENMAFVLFIGIVLFAFLLFKKSAVVWNLPLLSEINYPWIVLSQLGLIISILAGYLMNYKYFKIVIFGVTLLSLLLYIPLAKPSEYFDKGEGFYFTNDATTTSSHELMPLWVKNIPFERPLEKVQVIDGVGKISNLVYDSKKISFYAKTQKESLIRINTIYYPGWKILVNGFNQEINYKNDKGVMEIKLTKGNHVVDASFHETPLRKMSNIISIIGLFVMFMLIFKNLLIKIKWKF